MSAEMLPAGTIPEHAPHVIGALALMRRTTPVPIAVEVLFAAGDFPEPFTRADITPTDDAKSNKVYVSTCLSTMNKAGLLESIHRGPGDGRAPRYVPTRRLLPVSTAYNQLYTSLLSEFSGITEQEIWARSNAALEVIFFNSRGTPERMGNPVNTVAQLAGITPEHASQRALAGYADIMGYGLRMSRAIEKRVAGHPLAKRNKEA